MPELPVDFLPTAAMNELQQKLLLDSAPEFRSSVIVGFFGTGMAYHYVLARHSIWCTLPHTVVCGRWHRENDDKRGTRA